MSNPLLYIIILAGFLVFLGAFWLLRKYRIHFSIAPAPSHKPRHEPFYCLRANVRQISPHFYISQMVFSNKKNLPLDILGAPSQHSDQERNP